MLHLKAWFMWGRSGDYWGNDEKHIRRWVSFGKTLRIVDLGWNDAG